MCAMHTVHDAYCTYNVEKLLLRWLQYQQLLVKYQNIFNQILNSTKAIESWYLFIIFIHGHVLMAKGQSYSICVIQAKSDMSELIRYLKFCRKC